MAASHSAPPGDLACNPGMCPDWESNWRQFGLQASTQSTEPHQPGFNLQLLRYWHIVVQSGRVWGASCPLYTHPVFLLTHFWVMKTVENPQKAVSPFSRHTHTHTHTHTLGQLLGLPGFDCLAPHPGDPVWSIEKPNRLMTWMGTWRHRLRGCE